MIYALDTNIISYFLQGNILIKSRIRAALEEGHDVVIPPVTYYEIRRGFKHKSAPAKERAFENLCLAYSVGEMNVAIWECAAEIYGDSRRKGRAIDDADILIAAFCVANGYTLATNNTKHFTGIAGLQLVNWSK